jgi:hypothetical protein
VDTAGAELHALVGVPEGVDTVLRPEPAREGVVFPFAERVADRQVEGSGGVDAVGRDRDDGIGVLRDRFEDSGPDEAGQVARSSIGSYAAELKRAV